MPAIQIIAMCCLCKQVSDDAREPHHAWMKLHHYLDRHHLQRFEVRFSHTYCPRCHERQARAWRLAKPPRSTAAPKLLSK